MITRSPDSEIALELMNRINEKLSRFSLDKLATVDEFVAFLASRSEDDVVLDCLLTAHDMILASQDSLK